MKRLFSVFAMLAFVAAVYGQKDVTKFLGIPVDGYKQAMIQKLKAKGFTYNSTFNYLEGEFNGMDVNVYVVTNNNKVCRIMVADVNSVDETAIKIRFNTLCQQFQDNKKYTSLSEDFTLSDDEDISYEMTVHKKRYEAVFYQRPEVTDSAAVAKEKRTFLLSKYTEEQLDNPTKDIMKNIFTDTLRFFYERSHKKTVWFMIDEHYGKYRIMMYYDNEYNRANGEDL